MQKLKYFLADSTIDKNDIDDLVGWLQTYPWLSQGPLVKEFEKQWSAWLGVPFSTFVNSGSSANLLMYYAALLSGRLKNRKVIVPAISWATTIMPAIQLGFEPIMCDADIDTFGLCPQHLERLLKEHNPGAVIFVPTLGCPPDMAATMDLKKKYDFLLMEDACPATGARYEGKLVGNFGDMASFSLFFGHHLSTIEGGMVCTPHEDLADLLIQTRAHGWGKDIGPEKEAKLAAEHDVLQFNRPFTFYVPGFNVRSTDLNARLGLGQLKKVDWVMKRRTENHAIYQSRFKASPDFHCQSNPRATICSISFVALAESIEHRNRVGAALKEHRIETRPLGGGSMGRQPFWTERYGRKPFPTADRIHDTSFMLPNHPGLTPDDVNFICDVVLAVPATAGAPKARSVPVST